MFLSTLGVDGFDIQVLWEKSKSIFPPHHINFLSGNGFRKVCHRAGLSGVDISTPGKLDVDIVRNAVKYAPEVLSEKRFLKKLLENPAKAEAFQTYLAANCLSSHTWVIAKKECACDA